MKSLKRMLALVLAAVLCVTAAPSPQSYAKESGKKGENEKSGSEKGSGEITKIVLDVAGDEVVVYPQEENTGGGDSHKEDTEEKDDKKEESKGGEASVSSLLPLKEKHFDADLSSYTPLELTNVKVKDIFVGKDTLKDTDSIMWTIYYDDDYKITQSSGNMDLSCIDGYDAVEMIVGEADQLAASNIRYKVWVNNANASNWLTATASVVDDKGKEKAADYVGANYYAYNSSKELYIRYAAENSSQKIKIGLKQNTSLFPIKEGVSVKVYEGEYKSAKAAQKGRDITSLIWGNTGYEIQTSKSQPVTLVSYSGDGKATGCLSFNLYAGYLKDGIVAYGPYTKTEYGLEHVSETSRISEDGNTQKRTIELQQGYPANGRYMMRFEYRQKGITSTGGVTAAYHGEYESITEAEGKGAKDIKSQLFTNYGNGYEADYSNGVWFTVFIGNDGDKGQRVYKYYIITQQSQGDGLSSSTSCYFNGVVDGAGKFVKLYKMEPDTFAEGSYLTYFVDTDVNLTNLALSFDLDKGAKLYAAGSSTPEESEKSFHDFSKGAVQFTVSSEDGKHSGSYWVQIIKAQSEEGKLYADSLSDVNAKTEEKDGVIYTTREMMLDSYHGNIHYVTVANIGKNDLPSLSVTLDSDVLELDKYWTLNGKYELKGLNMPEDSTSSDAGYYESYLYDDGTVEDENADDGTADYEDENYSTDDSEDSSYEDETIDEDNGVYTYTPVGLSNQAMVRIKAKKGVKDGSDATGTLTFKSGDKTLMVMNITGVIGDPTITTKDIPKAVKYVPYGTMIQNSNKYSWNEVSYKLVDGKLPKGMVLKKNGEIYGVPKEEGKFKFTVQMDNSYKSFKSRTRKFTLKVVKNTNKNVDEATDKGYNLSKRISDTITKKTKKDSYLMVSEGIYEDFVDVYLDGKKLVKGKDYKSKSGSTRITISSQTLTKNKDYGNHTLGVEFRTQEGNELKRAAQNYTITKEKPVEKKPVENTKPDENKKPAEDNKPSNGSNPPENNTPVNNPPQNNTPVYNPPQTTNPPSYHMPDVDENTTSYTIKYGDNLWNIAVQKYGDGTKWVLIYEANKSKISNPSMIQIGQTFILP